MRYFTREGGGGTFRVCGWNWGGCYFVDFVELLGGLVQGFLAGIGVSYSSGFFVELLSVRCAHVEL